MSHTRIYISATRAALSSVQFTLQSSTATVSGSNQPSVVGLHCQRFKPTFSRPPSLSSVQTNLQSSAFTVLGSNQPSVVHRYCQRFKPTFSRRRGAARRVGLCGVGRLRPSQHRNATNNVATSQSRGNERTTTTNDDERRRRTTTNDDERRRTTTTNDERRRTTAKQMDCVITRLIAHKRVITRFHNHLLTGKDWETLECVCNYTFSFV